jgi:hypothetical protein
MFSQLMVVRLKAAENALRDGRLDEAYRLATAPDIREHRRGAAVLATLTERFIERARNHFRSDRFTEALIDLDRAEAGGVMKEQIAELRGHVQTVAAEQQRQEQSRRDRIEAARRRIEGGSLVAGRKMLEQANEDDHAAQQLRREADNRAAELRSILEQVESLMESGQLAAAADRLRRAKSLDAHHEAVVHVETQLCKRVLDNARDAISQGRLARASDELSCLGTLGTALPSRREFADLLATARQAAESLRAHAYADARRHVMSLARLLPKADWVEAAAEQLRQVEEIRTALCSGPLGERIDAGVAEDRPVARPSSPDDTVAIPDRVRCDTGLPDRLLLLVDGGGSYLLLRSDRASIGRVMSGDPADVPVLSDLAERHASINRIEDDYFLLSAKEVEVGGCKTQNHLLRDGDRIVLGQGAKFTFRLPTRKSSTAVLDLSDTTKLPNDVRRVVLFRHHATVANTPGAHIRCQHAGTPLVLFERGGAMWLRRKSDGHVDTEAVRLPLGEPIEFAGVSLVLEPWQVRTTGGRQV